MWIAEDVPAFTVDPTALPPDTAEDWAMAERVSVAKMGSEDAVRRALSGYLWNIAGYPHIQQGGKADLYRLAADVIIEGEASVRLDNRIYQVREI